MWIALWSSMKEMILIRPLQEGQIWESTLVTLWIIAASLWRGTPELLVDDRERKKPKACLLDFPATGVEVRADTHMYLP